MKTEQVLEDYQALDSWSFEQSLAAMVKTNQRAVEAVQMALPQLSQAAKGIKQKLATGGRLIYIGAGTSGRLALQDATELAPTFDFERTLVYLAGGIRASETAKENAEDDREDAIRSIQEAKINAQDAAIGIAASGRTPFTVAGLEQAKQQGAFTVGIANNANTPLLASADVAILLETGPEVLAGSTRLAAGTAQKIVLNALSTAVLVQLGGAYQNFMVGMRPKNDKLKKRAINIVSSAAQVTPEKAQDTLERSHWCIREAIVMLKAKLSLEEAQARLKATNNHVREAIKL